VLAQRDEPLPEMIFENHPTAGFKRNPPPYVGGYFATETDETASEYFA
jgi:hypothetical protein